MMRRGSAGPTESAARRWKSHLGTTAVALVLFTAPLVAEPQQGTKVARIVWLNPGPAPRESTSASYTQPAFRQALRDLGHIQGENILIEDRFAAGNEERLRAYAAEAVGLKVDVIVAVSSSAVRAATDATKTIPIVGLDLESDPVASGFVTSLGRPGGNLTGVFLDLPELSGKCPTRFEMIINLKTAKAIGLTIPPPLMVRADRVVQ